jgi:microcystin-dependent protein
MPLESAPYINSLNAANPVSTDSVAQADDHIRLIKSAIKATFPNITGPVTATESALNTPIPSGVIVMWSGSLLSIPTGWALCDGASGTPNLRDRFIVGAGTTYAVGATGGSLTSAAAGGHTHTEASAGGHNHTGATGNTTLTTAQMPAHTHTWSGLSTSEDNNFTAGATRYLKEGSTVNSGSFTETTSSVGSGEAHSHTIGTDGTHTHTINAVGDHTHSVTPPYYALAYIMKL